MRLFTTIISLIYVALNGFIIHMISHKINVRSSYDSSYLYLKKYKYLDKLIKFLISIIDFHDSTSINKQFKNNIIWNNLLFQDYTYYF